MNKTEIARVAHEVNKAYCEALGDNSQPSWDDAPQWQRDSAAMGVELHASGDHGPEASHASWMAQKVAEGWVYGTEKNPELKQHHCIVPFADLPQAQQAKDFIFRGVVHALRPAKAKIYICGVDCHKGDANCNGYCTGAAPHAKLIEA